jgi:hypothetical protein
MALFLEHFVSSFKEIVPGKFKHANSLPTKLHSENCGKISIFIEEIFDEIKVVRFY